MLHLSLLFHLLHMSRLEVHRIYTLLRCFKLLFSNSRNSVWTILYLKSLHAFQGVSRHSFYQVSWHLLDWNIVPLIWAEPNKAVWSQSPQGSSVTKPGVWWVHSREGRGNKQVISSCTCMTASCQLHFKHNSYLQNYKLIILHYFFQALH